MYFDLGRLDNMDLMSLYLRDLTWSGGKRLETWFEPLQELGLDLKKND